jgi:hypothetical protein
MDREERYIMALTKAQEEAIILLLTDQQLPEEEKPKRSFAVKLLRFGIVSLSLLLFITAGSLGVLWLINPQSASAASNTFSETWTATNGIYTQNTSTEQWVFLNQFTTPPAPCGCGQYYGPSPAPINYVQGVPANGTHEGGGDQVSPTAYDTPALFTVTGWTVAGTIQ